MVPVPLNFCTPSLHLLYICTHYQIGQLERLFDGRRFHIYLGKLRSATDSEEPPVREEDEADPEDLIAQAIGDIALEDNVPEDLQQELPISREPKRSEILNAIREHSAVVINGETGCVPYCVRFVFSNVFHSYWLFYLCI
jgi:hypothetical protein